MGAEADCVLAGFTLGAGTGAGTVWTSATPVQSREAGGGVSQDPIRADRLSNTCIRHSILSWSSSCWWCDTAAYSLCVAVSLSTQTWVLAPL